MRLSPARQRRVSRLIEGLIIITAPAAAVILWQWYQDGGGFEAVYVAVGVLLAALVAARRWLKQEPVTAREPSLTAATLENPRNRENLLNHVRTAWIDGFLKQSIHSEVLKLSLHYRPEAVGQRPWQLVLQQVGQPAQPVPAERTLPQIFDAAGRNLLILGAPGSGKTITMLQLAESLVAAAHDDPAEPLPIVLNLSSWAQHKGALADWLVEEIFVQYGVTKELTRTWIGGNRLLCLLDGLDEVAESARDDCITAINTFKEQRPAEMVVCSRSEDYEKLQQVFSS